MSIAERTLSRWSHHQAATAFVQAHLPIRAALDAYAGLSQFKYEVFLQGSYKNDTNLGGDSDVDVVVRLASKLKPRVAAACAAEGPRASGSGFPRPTHPELAEALFVAPFDRLRVNGEGMAARAEPAAALAEASCLR